MMDDFIFLSLTWHNCAGPVPVHYYQSYGWPSGYADKIDKLQDELSFSPKISSR